MKDIVDRAKLVITDPTGCWAKLKKTKRNEALVFLATLLVLATVLSLLVVGVRMGMDVVTMAWMAMVMALVVGFVLSVVSAWLINLVLGWLGVKGEWDTALKAVAYGSTPSGLLGWIPVLGLVGVVWSLVLQIIGLKTMYKTSYGKVILAVLICAVIVGAVMYLVTMFFGTTMMGMMGMAGGY